MLVKSQRGRTQMKPIRMFAATGMLGYGYAEESIQCALEMDLDLIAADAGSMDQGLAILAPDKRSFRARRRSGICR